MPSRTAGCLDDDDARQGAVGREMLLSSAVILYHEIGLQDASVTGSAVDDD